MKYIILSEDYDVYYTDDDEKAKRAAAYTVVYNTETKKQIDEDGNGVESVPPMQEYTE